MYSRAIDQGSVLAMCNLADLLVKGAEGVTADPARAVEMYSRVIEKGAGTEAMNSFGVLLQYGAEGVDIDLGRAVDMYRRAVDGGNTLAMHNLASVLVKGPGAVDPDPIRAVDLYSRAIDEGAHVDTMNCLANLLIDGAFGVAADPAIV